MLAARLFAAKSALATAGACTVVWERFVSGSFDLGGPLDASVAVALGGAPAYFAAVAIFGAWAALSIPRASVVRIDVRLRAEEAARLQPAEARAAEIAAASNPHAADASVRAEVAMAAGLGDGAVASAAHEITLWHPRLWSATDAAEVLPRSHLAGAPARATNLALQVLAAPGANSRRRRVYLWPQPGWTSDSRAYLCALLYADFFPALPDGGAPSDAPLLRGIDGFGSFRPAQFADPAAETSAALDAAAAAEPGGRLRDGALPGTPYFIARNSVWANFTVRPLPSIEMLREAERRAAMGLPPALSPPDAALPAPLTAGVPEVIAAGDAARALLPVPAPAPAP